MTAIITAKRRQSQIPRDLSAVAIDWTNDLAKAGLVSLVLPCNTANRSYASPSFVRTRYGNGVACSGAGFIWQRAPTFGSKASIFVLGGMGQDAGGTALPMSVGTTTSGGNQLFALQGFASVSLPARAIVRTSNGGVISTAELAGSGDGVVYPDDTTWLAVYDGTANLGLYRNGVNAVASRSNTAASGPLSSMDNIALGGVMRGTPTVAGGGSRQYLGMAFNTALNEAHAKELHRNPWQVLRPTTRRIWVPVSAGGGATSAPVGVASDTSSAFFLADKQRKLAGTSTSTDAAFGLAAKQAKQTVATSSTETAVALACKATKPVGISTESASALPLGSTQRKLAGLSAETDANPYINVAPLTKTVAAWTGSAWTYGELKRWNGLGWERTKLNRWVGAAWVNMQ